MKKILITGGHVTPALAVIDEIKKKTLPYEVIFVGRKYNNEFEKTTSFEFKEVSKRNISFINLTTGRFTRAFGLKSLQHLMRIPKGFWQAYSILEKNKPNIILSFGGYLALPVAIMGYLRGIPVYTHEQTIIPGLANKLIARVAKKILISFPESKKYFDQSKVVVTGNPVRDDIFITKNRMQNRDQKICIYITGGSLGSHSINQHIYNILPDLLNHYFIIHQTGNVKEFNDYERLKKRVKDVTPNAQENYIIKEHVTNEIGDIYNTADLVIGRSGANTFFELVALEKPAIYIPLPWSANGEQQKHAQIFKDNQAGEIFWQDGSSEDLLKLINSTSESLSEYKKNVKKLGSYYKKEAASTILEEIIR